MFFYPASRRHRLGLKRPCPESAVERRSRKTPPCPSSLSLYRLPASYDPAKQVHQAPLVFQSSGNRSRQEQSCAKFELGLAPWKSARKTKGIRSIRLQYLPHGLHVREIILDRGEVWRRSDGFDSRHVREPSLQLVDQRSILYRLVVVVQSIYSKRFIHAIQFPIDRKTNDQVGITDDVVAWIARVLERSHCGTPDDQGHEAHKV